MSSSVITAEEALNTILERYPSGASRCERLHYFALHAGNGTEDPTTDTAIRKAYRVLSETCKREGNVVRYKLVFGGQQQQQAGATTTTSHASGKSSKTSTSNNHRHQQQQQHAPEDASMNMDSGDGSGSDNNNNAHNMSGETTASSHQSGSSSHHQNHMVLSAAVPSPSGVDTGVVYDSAWVTEQEHAQRSHQQVLEHRLQVALSQLHKESIRAAYLALAAHATNCGDETGRFHALLRAKDYCTHKAQTIQVSLQIVSAALAIHNTVAAQEYIHKLQHTLRANNTTTNTASAGGAAATSGSSKAAASSSSSSTWVDQILVNTAAALERMAHGDFGGALSHWMNVVQHEELETAFNSEQVASLPYWVSVQDVSLYAALCCLTHGRPDQRTALADHVTALEYVPHLKQCLHDFSHAKYADVWQCVAVQCATSLRTDVVVGPHLPHLLSHVLRRKLLQQYWRAYTQVPLTVMAQDLGPSLVPSVDALRQEWIDMILEQQQQQPSSSSSKKKSDGKSETAGADADKTTTTADTSSSSSEAMADTRLNLATDTLHRDEDRTKTQRRQALQLAKLTQHVLNDSYAMTIRLACQEHDLCVVNPLAGTVGGGKAGGARPRGRTRGGMMAMGGGGASAGDPILMDDDVVSGNDDADDLVAMESDEAAVVAVAAAGETEEDDDDEEDTTMVDASAMNPEDLY